MKLDFLFVRSVNLKLEISLKLNEGSDEFLKGSNWYLQKGMESAHGKELTVWIMKSGIQMEHPSGIIIKDSGGLTNCYLHN